MCSNEITNFGVFLSLVGLFYCLYLLIKVFIYFAFPEKPKTEEQLDEYQQIVMNSAHSLCGLRFSNSRGSTLSVDCVSDILKEYAKSLSEKKAS